MLTHDSFASYLLATVMPADPDEEETNLLTVPMYHIAGLQATLAAVYGGRTLVVMRQFDAVDWMESVQKYRANRAMLVPTMLKQLMDHPRFDEFDLSSLDVITYGAAPMPVDVIRQAIRKFPAARFINAFGRPRRHPPSPCYPRKTTSWREAMMRSKRNSSVWRR